MWSLVTVPHTSRHTSQERCHGGTRSECERRWTDTGNPCKSHLGDCARTTSYYRRYRASSLRVARHVAGVLDAIAGKVRSRTNAYGARRGDQATSHGTTRHNCHNRLISGRLIQSSPECRNRGSRSTAWRLRRWKHCTDWNTATATRCRRDVLPSIALDRRRESMI